MNEQKKREILELIEKIKKEDFLVVVEGKKDKDALLEFGIENIFILKKGNLPEAIERIIKLNKKTIILTDFDSEGKKLYYILKRELVKNGIRIDERLRKKLMREKLSHIEGLISFLS